jgi:diacylglycerol kinase (ATP)
VRIALVGHGEVSLPGAERFALEALDRVAAWRPERIVVAGGDGTIAPCADLAGRLGVPLAVVPSGTANDFARAHGLPLDVRVARELARWGTRTVPLELGRLAGGRPFVNVASAGLAPLAARYAAPWKARLGPLAYPLGALRAAGAPPLEVEVRVDGLTVFAGRAWQVIVACTGAFGGGAAVEADPADGALDVAVLAGSRLALVRHARELLSGAASHARGLLVEVLGAGELNVDGEVVGGGLERVTADAHAFGLVVPSATQPPRPTAAPPRSASASRRRP